MTPRQRLEAKTVAQLRVEARQAGHEGISRLRKAALVDLLLKDVEREPPAPETVRRPPGRGFGRLLQGVAVAGALVGLAFTLLAPVASVSGSRRLAQGLRAAAESAEGLAGTVRASERSLERAAAALEAAQAALTSIEGSLDEADPLLATVEDLLAEELPSTIETTRSSLNSAEQGAAAMDRVLRGLRFFGLSYDPSQPLNQSLAETADSLEPLPGALLDVERELAESRSNLKEVRLELLTMASELTEMSTSLETTAANLGRQSAQLDRVSASLDRWAGRFPLLGWIGAVASGLFGLWLVVVNMAVFEVGRVRLAQAAAGEGSPG